MIERVMVAGGGTGGHLFPGIAVIEELKRRVPGLDVVYVGTARGIEARVIPARGEQLELIAVTGLKGRSGSDLGRSLLRLPKAGLDAIGILRRHRPDIVIGVGGYASGPMLAAAALLGVPTVVLEQNATAGMTNRLLSQVVGRAYVTFSETAKSFSPSRVRVVGNPIRRDFVEVARRAAMDPDGFEARANDVLVFGGSQGAQALNLIVPAALARVGVGERKMRIVHQAGRDNVDEVKARYEELGVSAEVVPFIDDMARAYATAAVVIARAGATTIAEICALGRASILIPYPHAADDHQRKNAQSLEGRGAAVCLVESELSAASLADCLRGLLEDRGGRAEMASRARRLGKPDAAAAIVDDLCSWLGCDQSSRSRGQEPAEVDPPTRGGLPSSEPDPVPDGSPHGGAKALRGRQPYSVPARGQVRRRRSSVPVHRRPSTLALSAWD